MSFRLPYLHALGAGVHVGPNAVTWTSLRRSGRTVAVVFRATEPVVEGDVDAALHRLRDRVPKAARPGGPRPLVAARLDALLSRVALLEPPALDESDLRDAWLHTEAERLLPPGGRIEDFTLRVQPVGPDSSAPSCLVSLARRASVDARDQCFDQAGFRLLCLTLPETDLPPLLNRLPAFSEGGTAVLTLRPADATLFVFREGRPDAVHRLLADDPDAPADALLQAAHALLASEEAGGDPDRLFVLGPESAVHRARTAGLIAGPILPARLSLPGCDDVPLTGAAFEAAALALGALSSTVDGVNLLPPETVRLRRQALEKAEAARAMLCVGAVLALAFGLLLLAQTAVGLARKRTDRALDLLADRLADIEAARSEVARLEANVHEADRLIAAQTHTARVLETAGRAAPPEVWLERIRIEPAGADTLHVRLNGTALHDGPVAAYLDRLERGASADAVRLVFTESVPAARVYPDVDALQPGPVTRFEIGLRRPAASFSRTALP